MHRMLALVLSLLLTAYLAPATMAVDGSVSGDRLWNQPGPGTVRNETGGSGSALYVVRHQAPSLAQYRGGIDGLAPTSPEATGAARLDTSSAASRAYLDYLDGLQAGLIASIEGALRRDIEVAFRYTAVYNGIAVHMTPNEAQRVAALPGVRHVERDSTRELHTDNGPVWIGADEIWGEDPPTGNAACVGTCGEGVVVGIIDTGINFDHPSFADIGGDGYDHTNPRAPTFYGACAPVTGLPFCNDKLIGYYDFTGTGPEDDNGHGSHVASTAAGNVMHAVVEAPTITLERDVSGVAPHANIISYKGCSGTPVGCQLSALVAAINQATLDGVDVINYSIGGGSANPWDDLDAQAFFDAYTAGIFVATSAGNDGPGAGTLGSPGDAPWVTTVAASTHDRKLANGIVDMTNLDSSAGPADIFGKSLTAGHGPARVVYAGDYAAESNDPANAHLCGSGVGDPATGEGSGGDPWPAGTFNGEIVLCERGEYGRVMKGEYVRRAGAGGVVLMNDAASGDSLVGDPYTLPGVHITHADGLIVKQWIANNGGKNHQGTARINGSNPSENPAFGDIIASFSSRGPNPAAPSLIKPDVTAPGVDILAAWMSPVGSIGETEWGIISGTSMSSPHTAGAAALVRGARPAWSPDAVKSALMTTSFTDLPGNGAEVHGVLKEDSATPADPFDHGAGRIDLHVAAQAGIVFLETAADYEAANPSLGGDATTLNIASLGNDSCRSSCSWTRSITSTAGSSVTWTPSATAPAGMTITFDEATYALAPGETVDITITANVDGVSPKGRWTFAEVQLTPSVASVPPVHLPLAVVPDSGTPAQVLHMHGNVHDGCTGNGTTDVVAGAGGGCQPHLSPSDVLDTAQAAAWGPISPAAGSSAAQNIYDPNWIWQLSEETTLHGPMTVEYWYTSPNKELVFNLDFTIRLFADGVLVTEQVVRHNTTLPNTELFRDTIDVPKVTASDSYVVQIDPFFATQEGAFIYYDSTQSCPGTLPGTTAACDSRVSMPVVELIDNPPVANDDEAFVVRGGSGVIDVLANDFDAEGPLALAIVSAPANGTADVTTDNRISYSHDGSATASDSLVYEITDTAGQKDQATVLITIADECFAPAGDYAIDFESGSPGWLVDTAVLTPPSQTWQLFSPDPFATSGTTVWFTDAATFLEPNLGPTTKDVRLVTPEFLLSGDSHLTFFHRFRTEVGFDGGVLEARVNGGAWEDILDAGGVFLAGAYNDRFSASGFVLANRDGWGGESVGFLDGDMNQVDVDLGALAASTVQFRFRFGQDELVGEAGGWWIDDFAVSDLLEPCGEPPVANPDSASVDAGMSVNIDVLANDSNPEDPDAELTVTIESAPSHGTAAVEADQTVTYTHNGDTAAADSFVYRVTNPDGGFDTATVSITINQPQNATPDAVDDDATVDRGGSTTIDVKANDSDPDDDDADLEVTIETPPSHGSAGVTPDGQVTYTHNGDSATSDSFEYRLTDPQGAFDIATVSITIDQAAADLRQTTGGGFLHASQGGKINFGFHAVEGEDGSPTGELQLNDHPAKIKIHIYEVLGLRALSEQCGTVPAGENAVEFTGTGTYNKQAASFRVCVADFGEPGNSKASDTPDMFHLECVDGCAYDTSTRASDEKLDGGNIQVHNPPPPTGGDGTDATQAGAETTDASAEADEADEAQAATLILDPVLLSEAKVGSVQQLTVRAFGADQQPLANAAISLNVLNVSGTVLETLTGVSDDTGALTLRVVVNPGGTEYLAWSGSLSSNAILISGRF